MTSEETTIDTPAYEPPPADSALATRGRPTIGAIAGVLLGVFLAADLLLLGTIRLDSWLILALPVVLGIAGWAVGWFAPLRFRRRSS